MFVTIWRLSLGILLLGVVLLFGGIFTNFALSLVGLVLIGLWVAVWFAGIYYADRWRDSRLQREGVQVDADVTGWNPQGPMTGTRRYSATAGFISYTFSVEVRGQGGQLVSGTDNVWASVHHHYPVGSKIPIVCARSDPSISKVDERARQPQPDADDAGLDRQDEAP